MDYSAKRLPGTLETVVFHETLRRGYKVLVGTVSKLEIDFLPQLTNDLLSLQIATYLTEESTIEEEFGNLEKIYKIPTRNLYSLLMRCTWVNGMGLGVFILGIGFKRRSNRTTYFRESTKWNRGGTKNVPPLVLGLGIKMQ